MNKKQKEKIKGMLIKYFGTQKKLADKLKIDQSAVSLWFIRNTGVPLKRAVKIQQITKGAIKVSDLIPELKKI